MVMQMILNVRGKAKCMVTDIAAMPTLRLAVSNANW
jgi:hypothetical protein